VNRLIALARPFAVAAVLAVSGCSSSTATPFPPNPESAPPSATAAASATEKAVAVPTPGRTAAPQATGGRATVAPVTINDVTVDYTYKNALITPIAHLYGTYLDDFVVVHIQNGNSSPVKLVVKSEISGFTDTAVDTVTVRAHGTMDVRQNPRLKTSSIDELDSQRPADLHVTASYLDNGVQKTILDETKETLITSRRDFPWSIKGMDQQTDFELIGAMVTPSDPAVESLLRAAANYDPSHSMVSGYDSERDSSGAVYQRLADIWQAEDKDYSLTYISTTMSFAPGQSQRIRLPAEVLDQASGNCIELVLLYAAAVEALNMQPVVILVPGHAYLGVRTDGANDNYYFVETTMIGGATFDQAVKYAGDEFDKARQHIIDGDQDYGWVSVVDGRKNGILPIPWR
jgi:hypothetical protein